MKLLNDTRKECEYEKIWIPKTPLKSTPPRLKSKDVVSVSTSSSAILNNPYNGLIQRDGEEATKTKRKGKKKKRYRPKVVKRIKIWRSPKTKTPNPSTPKPHTPKPPNRGNSRKSLHNKSAILKSSDEASEHACIDSCQVLDPSPEIPRCVITKPISSAILSRNFDINNIQENGLGVLDPPVEEYTDKSLGDLKPEVESKPCRRALSFSLSFENDGGENRGDVDGKFSSDTLQRGGNSSGVIVYHRKRFNFGRSSGNSTRQRGGDSSGLLVYQRKKFKLGGCDLMNCRKFGPDFPKLLRKRRTERPRSFIIFLNSWLAVRSQSGNTINNSLNSIIGAKDTNLNIVKKGRTRGRKKRVFPALTSVSLVGSEEGSLPKCEELLETSKSSSIIPVTQRCVPPLPSSSSTIPRVRTITASQPKYCGALIPHTGPPQKKLRILEDVIKKLQRFHIDDLKKRPGPKKKYKSGVGDKSSELVLYNSKKLVPKVVINHETEREWNLLLQAFRGGAEEKRNQDSDKYWEEERRAMRVRLLTFLALMHIIQGDRRFTEWKGSVVDSVVGVFLTQNVSDHLSSSAFMSLASRFPLKPKNEVAYVICRPADTLPIVEEVEPENGDLSRNNHHLESENVVQMGSPSVTIASSSSKKNQEQQVHWDELRRTYGGGKRDTTGRYADSVDWEAVRVAPPKEVSSAIRIRGQHVIIGEKIQLFLNRILKDHGSLDMEWLRNVPPDKAKEYLLSFYGLGLKSVECIRLLCLRHHAFPVDINVARVAVRLGWVPLEKLPGGLEFHLLEEYPIADAVQVYLWPRLCTLDQNTLYELHYQMITFGKIFCKKRKPSCATCPMREDCKHRASQLASSRLSLPMTEKKSASSEIISIADVEDSPVFNATTTDSPPSSYGKNDPQQFLVELPPSPVHVSNNGINRDIEDWYGQIEEEDHNLHADEDEDEDEDGDVDMNVVIFPTFKLGTEEKIENEDDMPIIKLGTEELEKRFREAMHKSDIVVAEEDVSKALVALTSGPSQIPAPKLKNVGRLKTVHHVYELPDNHPILAEVEKREADDPSPYLLVVWASSNTNDQNSETVPGTLMIPCRTANGGSFPLNGTYFQVNEVFADYESAEHPLQVPREWLWNLRRRFVYCGSSASTIFTAISIEEIQHCFWRGSPRYSFIIFELEPGTYWLLQNLFKISESSNKPVYERCICVRAFNRRTRAPVELPHKFHQFTGSKSDKRKHTQDV